jgi:hypothetical protein
MSTVTPMLQPASRELSPTERALVQALVSAIVRELKAAGVTTKAA